jgi:hypothetical protein
MIERFNFYDVYGYLIPGFVWLILLALPLQLAGHWGEISAAELTSALAISYVAGHYLSGLARQALPSAKYRIGTELVPKSVVLMWPDYNGKDKLPGELRSMIAAAFKDAFRFDPTEPFKVKDVGQMFFLCRAKLTQAKLGAYIEQYQGMMSLTRSLSLAFSIAAAYFTAWIIGASLGGSSVLGLMVVATAIVSTEHVDRRMAAAGSDTPSADFSHPETVALIVLVISGGAAAGLWLGLSSRHGVVLALGATTLWFAAIRMRAASHAFDGNLAAAVYRDFFALVGAKPLKKTILNAEE